MQCHCQLPTRHSLYGQRVFQPATRRHTPRRAAPIRAAAVTQVPTSLSTSRYALHSSTRFSLQSLRISLQRLTHRAVCILLICVHPAEYGRQHTNSCRWRRVFATLYRSTHQRLSGSRLSAALHPSFRFWSVAATWSSLCVLGAAVGV